MTYSMTFHFSWGKPHSNLVLGGISTVLKQYVPTLLRHTLGKLEVCAAELQVHIIEMECQ